jgi:hypothetical protein
MVTCNHIHLLVRDTGANVIAGSITLAFKSFKPFNRFAPFKALGSEHAKLRCASLPLRIQRFSQNAPSRFLRWLYSCALRFAISCQNEHWNY